MEKEYFFSAVLMAISGMLIMDTILVVFFLRKYSEGVLELLITVLIVIISTLLMRNPIPELSETPYSIFAITALIIVLSVMFYHLFRKVIPEAPYYRKRKQRRLLDKHAQEPPAKSKNHAHR